MTLAFEFAWWNTSLTRSRPKSGADRGAIEKHDVRLVRVAKVVNDLLAKAHLVALGEVTRSEFERLRAWLGRSEHEWRHNDRREMAVILDGTAAALESSQHLEVRVGTRNFSSAWKHTLRLTTSRTWLDFYVVHWPSDLSKGAEEHRRSIGEKFREQFDSSRLPSYSEDLADWHQVVLGDFNEEPFSTGLNAGMKASRDRTRVQNERDAAYLYNPCWRLLGERDDWPRPAGSDVLPGGSYYNPGSGPSRWQTIDQVLVGRTLLGEWGWILDEARLGYLPHECVYSARKGNMISQFDHLPLVGRLVHRQGGLE